MSSISETKQVGIARPSRVAAVKADIDRARKAWRERTHARDGIYKYLQVVFEIGKRWKREHRVVRNSIIVREHCNRPNKPKSEMMGFPVIIWATAELPAADKGKSRSKWSRLLQLAEERDERTIEAFVWEYGGINECLAQLK